MIYPTSCSPSSVIALFDGITIAPYKRILIQRSGVRFYYDSVLVEGAVDVKKLESWIIFHSLIFNFQTLIYYYKTENPEEQNFIETTEPLAYQKDYSSLFEQVYFFCPEVTTASEGYSYSELYKKFLEQPHNHSLVKNYFQDFTSQNTRLRDFIDPTYWQMMVYYSIIENILGIQPDCSNHPICCICNKNCLHRPISSKDWVVARFNEIVQNTSISSEYSSLYLKIAEQIRHNTVHSAMLPTSLFHQSEKVGIEEIYYADRSLKDFKEDSTALLSLKISIQDIARYLLLNKIFGFTVFPALKPLKALKIVSSG